MKQREIKAYSKELAEIQKADFKTQRQGLIDMQKRIGLAVPVRMQQGDQEEVYHRIQGISTRLQSEMMLHACISAKWSCAFAASAAVLSLLATAIALVSFLTT